MPYVNYTPIETPNRHWNMSELGWLSRYGWDTYLNSDDDVESRPDWLGGKSNIPGDSNGNGDGDDDGDGGDDDDDDRFHWDDDDETPDTSGYTEEEARREAALLEDTERLDEDAYLQAELDEEAKQISSELKKRSLGGSPISLEQGGRSDAPVILISVDKGNGVVDAFWFFFYSYNLGNKVVNVRFGNHVGDWEHTVVRFVDGLPTLVFFSEHFFGEAYTYAAVEKKGKRVSLYHLCCSQRSLVNVLLSPAHRLFCHRYSRHVWQCWRTSLRPAMGAPPRCYRPRPALGPGTKLPLLHLRSKHPHHSQFNTRPIRTNFLA